MVERARRWPPFVVTCGIGAAALASCGHDDDKAMPLAAAAVLDAGGPETGADAETTPAPILPYPPGPYRAGIGDVMPDFKIRGYALAPGASDSTRLPFRSISLAEVRSDPQCSCIAIAVTGCGTQCGPCVTHDRTLTMLRAKNPSLCVMEVLASNYDGEVTGTKFDEDNPTTRADVDTFTQSGRENYPVGLATQSATAALNEDIIHAIPSTYVLRASDMRVLDYIAGSGSDFGAQLDRACRKTSSNIQDLVAGVSPRKIVVDKTHVYATDWNTGLYRVPRSGGAIEPLLHDTEQQDTLRLDKDFVYFVSDGPTTHTLRSLPKAGGTPTTLVTSAATIVDFAVDDTTILFAQGDGSISRIPKSGGASTLVVSGENAPDNVRVDSAHVYWIARGSGDVARAPKSGGPRETLLAAGGLPLGDAPRFMEVTGLSILVANSGLLFRVPLTGGAPVRLIGAPALTALSDEDGFLLLASRHAEYHTGSVYFNFGNQQTLLPLTPGQRNVYSVAGGHGEAFWTVNADDVSLNAGAIRVAR